MLTNLIVAGIPSNDNPNQALDIVSPKSGESAPHYL
jgi:hypothetical protein